MTRKEYVVAVTEQLAANPRAVLAGHRIPAAILTRIAERPDVLAKIAAFGFMTKKFKMGAKGLRKSPVFKVSGYKNFPDFNKVARTDVENFVNSLPEGDAENFQNNENIITLLILPDTKTGETNEDIVNGKSVVLKFDASVKKEYRINGGFYVTIMFGDSAIRTPEQRVAKAKAKVNATKVNRKRRSVALVRRELVNKAKAKQAALDARKAALEGTSVKLSAEMQQYAHIANEFGVTLDSPKDIAKAMRNYTRETKAFLKKLTKAEQVVYNEVMKAMKKGDMRTANALLKSLGNEQLTNIVKTGNLTSAEARTAARTAELRKQVRELTKRNEGLLVKLEGAATARAKAQIRFDMRKNITRINQLKARIGAHKDVSAKAITTKAKMLAKTNELIAENIAKGLTVQESLNAALAKLQISQEAKQQVKQQVIQQVANEMPTQYAVQQAIQQIPVEAIQQVPVEQVIDLDDESDDFVDVFGDEGVVDAATLVGAASINDVLSIL